MAGARKFSYKKAVALVKQHIPELFQALALEYPNPYSSSCRRTKTHVILAHSAIEYFLRIEDEK
jgi:hypothetical protein